MHPLPFLRNTVAKNETIRKEKTANGRGFQTSEDSEMLCKPACKKAGKYATVLFFIFFMFFHNFFLNIGGTLLIANELKGKFAATVCDGF